MNSTAVSAPPTNASRQRTGALGKASERAPYIHTVLSNVPGPREPTYVANGLMEESIPLIPTCDFLALSGGIASIRESITFGFHCDGGVVPDPDLFVEGVEAGLEELRRAVQPLTEAEAGAEPR